MSEEIFDVVDDRDRVIGRQTRREVHARGLKHRAVHVLVFNQRGELFLQKRSFKKDTFPGAWDSSASGHLNSGEHYDPCAVRELREEIGLFLQRSPKRQFKIDACEQTGREFVWVYRCEANGPFRLNQEELECGAFFKPDHINRWMAERPRDFADSFRLVWKYFLNPPPPKPPKEKPTAKPAKVKMAQNSAPQTKAVSPKSAAPSQQKLKATKPKAKQAKLKPAKRPSAKPARIAQTKPARPAGKKPAKLAKPTTTKATRKQRR